MAVGLLGAASAAYAGPASEWRYIGEFQPAAATTGLATVPFQSAGGLGTKFDAAPWSGDSGSARTASALTLDAQTAAATDASTVSADTRLHALATSSTASNTSPVTGSPAALDLTLWNFITNIRSQQASNPFVQLRTNAANIDYTLNDVPAPVPIPPAFWLFAGGLAVLVGARRFMRRTGTRNTARMLVAA